MSTNITVILPIHELQDKLEDFLKIAINSINKQTLLPDNLLIVTSTNSVSKCVQIL